MSLKQLAIGLAILLYGVINVKGTHGLSLAFWITVIVVGGLWMLEQLVPAVTTVSRPTRKQQA